MNENIPILNKNIDKKCARETNPLVLAYIGDCVHSMYVRTKLANETTAKSGKLHKLESNVVNAKNQCRTVESLMDEFTEEEKEIFLRARNSKANTQAKNTDIQTYKKSSGYEAVIGYLYLIGENERLAKFLEKGDINDN